MTRKISPGVSRGNWQENADKIRHLNTSMVLRRFLLPRVLVVTALIPVPRVHLVHGARPGADVRPAVFRRLLLRVVDRHPAGGVVDRGVAVSPR